MSIQLQLRRGTTEQNDLFVGAVGELTVDTTTNELRIHDGITPGGHKVSGGYHPPLLSWLWSDCEFNDVQWLRSDTFSWQRGAVYEAVYGHLADCISGKSLQSETVAGTTIQFYLADNGRKICPANQENNVTAIYNATGIAWYYILDTVNQRFKLPRDNSQNKRVLIKDIQSGTKWARVYSDGWVEQGGPDNTMNKTINLLITMADTNYTVTCGFVIENQGAQYVTKATTSFTTSSAQHNSATNGGWLVAGYANTTYLKNVVSQFEAQYKYLYFYVGNFTQSAVENTAGLNAELFNNKVDLTSSWSFPDTHYDVLSLTATGQTFVAPEDGWFSVSARSNNIASWVFMTIQGTGIRVTSHVGQSGANHEIFIPASKGQTCIVEYDMISQINSFYFTYAKKTN